MSADPPPRGRPTRWAGTHEVAEAHGPAAALDALAERLREDVAAGGPVVAVGPGGHVVASRPLVESAHWALRGDALVRWDPAAGTRLHHPVLDASGLVAIRLPGEGARGGPANPRLAAGLGWLRLGLSRRLLARVLAHLRRRTVGDTPLLDTQLVKADLAAAATDQLQARLLLDGGSDTVRAAHRRLTGADRTLVRLLGASGYLLASAGADPAVSTLLADTYGTEL